MGLIRLTAGIIIIGVGVMAFVNSLVAGVWQAVVISLAIGLVGWFVANMGE